MERVKELELKRDILVRQLRKEQDYKKRCEMNEKLDAVCDELEHLLTCSYCGQSLKNCVCSF